ncbi:uncharacterized protein [Montipora capricornis]|uniref:uncharacterized protein n=1 Tax=Montipora capricornis TaxID=246305 RepID=UPI0035F1D1A5
MQDVLFSFTFLCIKLVSLLITWKTSMRPYIPFMVILFALFSSRGLGTKPEYHLRRELLAEKGEATKLRSREKLLREAPEKSRVLQRKGKLDKNITGTRRHLVEIHASEQYPRSSPLTKQLSPNELLSEFAAQYFSSRPPERKTNIFSRNVPDIENMSDEPRGDFDEVVTEEGTSSRITKQDAALLRRLMKNKKGLNLENSGRSFGKNQNKDKSAAGHHNVGKNHRGKSFEGHMRSQERSANAPNSLAEAQNKGQKRVKKVEEKLRKTLSQKNEDKKEQTDENDGEEDGMKNESGVPYEAEQLRHFLSKRFRYKNVQAQSLTLPHPIPNHVIAPIMPSFWVNQEPFETPVSRDPRPFGEIRDFQKQQIIIPRLQLAYPAQIPLFIAPQLWHLPVATTRFPLVVGPTFYQPPNRGSFSHSFLPALRGNQGYTINVNGMRGVFSKDPGFVVRFHSPDSEVTVVKKKSYLAAPIGWLSTLRSRSPFGRSN